MTRIAVDMMPCKYRWRAARIYGSQHVRFARGRGTVVAHANMALWTAEDLADIQTLADSWAYMLG